MTEGGLEGRLGTGMEEDAQTMGEDDK